MVIVPDRRPPDKLARPARAPTAVLTRRAHRSPAARRQDRAGGEGADCQHPGGGGCKDADDVLRQHGPSRPQGAARGHRGLSASLDGEARRLAQIDDPLERDAQTKARRSS